MKTKVQRSDPYGGVAKLKSTGCELLDAEQFFCLVGDLYKELGYHTSVKIVIDYGLGRNETTLFIDGD